MSNDFKQSQSDSHFAGNGSLQRARTVYQIRSSITEIIISNGLMKDERRYFCFCVSLCWLFRCQALYWLLFLFVQVILISVTLEVSPSFWERAVLLINSAFSL